MILANYTQQNRNCVREWGVRFTNPFSQFKPQLFNSFYVPDTLQESLDKSAFPHGYNTEFCWNLSLKSGGIASTLNVNGQGVVAADILAVKLLAAAIAGAGNLTATAELIVQMFADLLGSGEVSNADVKAFLLMVANIIGTGGASAIPKGLAALVAAIEGDGTLAGSTISGFAEMIADIVVTGTALSTANVGAAVWSSIAAVNNVAGTMGEKLNDAGAAGDPWGTLLPGSYPASSAGQILATRLSEDSYVEPDNAKIEETWRLAGLDSASPMTVTPTSRTTSGITLTISGDGTTITTVIRE